MILESLTRHYEYLVQQGELDPPGWSHINISYVLNITEDGEVESIESVLREKTVGKKTIWRPTPFTLPAAVHKTSGSSSNFLWENSGYLFGVKQKEAAAKSQKDFMTAAILHKELLRAVDSPTARGICAFFEKWIPTLDHLSNHPAFAELREEVIAGNNIMFRVNGVNPAEDPAIQDAWIAHYDGDHSGTLGFCNITGEEDEIPLTHPVIKGVQGAQSSGAMLVSFNANAFCSRGHQRGMNASVGKYAAFAYTSALNYLLADRRNTHVLGDTTVVCWCESGEPTMMDLVNHLIFGEEKTAVLDSLDARLIMEQIANGEPVDHVNPSQTFYILGLSPNAGRLSVRFFLQDTFGDLMRNVQKHYNRLSIVGSPFDSGYMPTWALLKETVRQNTTGKAPAINPVMAGATTNAIFSGAPYPESLVQAVLTRIKAERDVSPGKAAIIKAYMIRNLLKGDIHSDSPYAGVARVNLNEDCDYLPYNLGRLFYHLEYTQLAAADWTINRSIKDRSFNEASHTPRSAFRSLLPLNEKHMNKLFHNRKKTALAKKLAGERADILCKIDLSQIPVRFGQRDTMAFYMGYYHQQEKTKTDRKEAKEAREAVEAENTNQNN